MNMILTQVLSMRKTAANSNLILYEMGKGGNGASVIIEVVPEDTRYAAQGYGSVHYVAFRVKDQEVLSKWIKHLTNIGARHSDFVDRFYFQSLYSRLYPGILF